MLHCQRRWMLQVLRHDWWRWPLCNDDATVKDTQMFGLAIQTPLRHATYNVDLHIRFASGDIIPGVGVESNKLHEIAYDGGRRFEMYVTDTPKRMQSDLQDRIEELFSQYFNTGIFRGHHVNNKDFSLDGLAVLRQVLHFTRTSKMSFR